MIWLSRDCLLFELASGERVPFTADTVSVELAGEATGSFDADFLRQATKAVFHYFQHELKRETVTLAEFSAALEEILRGFTLKAPPAAPDSPAASWAEADLGQLAVEAGETELLFFCRLRDALRSQLRHAPRVLRFHGLRGCVKRLTGARRWSPRCQELHDRIVEYLRACAAADRDERDCALMVE
jgi:hypothetical protein